MISPCLVVSFLLLGSLLTTLFLFAQEKNPTLTISHETPSPQSPKKLIISTDFGTDIDDTWALALLLQTHLNKDVSIIAIVTTTFDTASRARTLAKWLTDSGSPNIPIFIGEDRPRTPAYSAAGEEAGYAWSSSYDLDTYAGPITTADNWLPNMINLIQYHGINDVTWVELSPPDNYARLADAGIAPKVVGMGGSVAVGYDR